MHQLENFSPFVAQTAVNIDPQGGDCIVLGVKASFSILPSVTLLDEQKPFVLADEYLADPGASSLAQAAEMLLPKPGCDLVLKGHAYAPTSQPVDQIDTRLSVGDVSKTLRVFGDRLWIHGGLSAAKPFLTMPLIYENAFGGVHHFKPEKDIGPDSAISVEENPVGKGFIGKRTPREMVGQALPNIEDPRYLIRVPQDKPQVAGYGHIASAWQPRRSFCGTYDQQWQRTRAPLLPLDFDSRYLMTGSEGLSFLRRHFQGGEVIRLQNLAPQSDIQFALPSYALQSFFKLDGSWYESPLSIETVTVEPDENTFTVLWKGLFSCNKKVRRVSHIRIDLKSTTGSLTTGSSSISSSTSLSSTLGSSTTGPSI